MVNYLKFMCEQWMGNDVQPVLLYDVIGGLLALRRSLQSSSLSAGRNLHIRPLLLVILCKQVLLLLCLIA
jgi:hypothetical protein